MQRLVASPKREAPASLLGDVRASVPAYAAISMNMNKPTHTHLPDHKPGVIEHFDHTGTDLFRMAGLSDAIFAIVLTLLVLELKLPEAASALVTDTSAALTNGDLARRLAERVPQLIGYVQSFLVAAVYWVAHHWDFEHIRHYDRRLLWLNLMFLLCLGLMPFSTALVGAYGDLTLGWGIYAVNMALIGFMLCALWRYAVAQQFVEVSLGPTLRRYVTLRHVLLPALFLLSIALAQIHPRLAQASPLLILPAQWLLQKVMLRAPAQAHTSMARPWLWRAVTVLPLVLIFGGFLWLVLMQP